MLGMEIHIVRGLWTFRDFSPFCLVFSSIQHATYFCLCRPGRSHVGYSGSRSISGHDSAYGSSRHGMGYGGIVLKALLSVRHFWSFTYFNFHVNLHSTLAGSASGGDAGGMYSSSYSGSYTSRGSDVSIFEISTHFFYYFFVSSNSFEFSIWPGWWEFIFITLLGP